MVSTVLLSIIVLLIVSSAPSASETGPQIKLKTVDEAIGWVKAKGKCVGPAEAYQCQY